MKILLVDDENLSLKAIAGFLRFPLNHEVISCGDGIKAGELYEANHFPLVISDIQLPGMDGIQLTTKIKQSPQGRFTDVVLITGYGNLDSAIRALRAGAYDYLLKPIDIEELALIVTRVEEHLALLKENIELKENFENRLNQAAGQVREKYEQIRHAYSRIVGVGQVGIFSPQMRQIKNLAQRLHQDRELSVLIQGETGTGKEVTARLVHYGEGDVTSPFISINCSAIPPNLFETELFGYEPGAFTDAKKKGAIGKLELAQGGTIFLDEIGDLPLDIQPKLLRVLEERSFYRVGGLQKIQLDIRVICATNHDLAQDVEKGAFRRDLFYRLNVGYIHLPPLREQRDAIAPLAQMFLLNFAARKQRRFQFFPRESAQILENYSWPGNIRELQNLIERVVLLYDDIEVRPDYLIPLTPHGNHLSITTDAFGLLAPGKIKLPEQGFNLRDLEFEIVQKALTRFHGNRTRTAEYLGLSRSALRSKIKEE